MFNAKLGWRSHYGALRGKHLRYSRNNCKAAAYSKSGLPINQQNSSDLSRIDLLELPNKYPQFGLARVVSEVLSLTAGSPEPAMAIEVNRLYLFD